MIKYMCKINKKGEREGIMIRDSKNPDVNLSWFLEENSYTKEHGNVTMESEKGKKQLVDTILMLIDQGHEIRIGTDGECLMLESNYCWEDEGCGYQWVDADHYVESFEREEDFGDTDEE